MLFAIRFRRISRILTMAWDFIAVVLAGYMALQMRFDGVVPREYLKSFYTFAMPVGLLWVGSYSMLRVYDCLWNAPASSDFTRIIAGAGCASLVSSTIVWVGSGGYPRGALAVASLLSLILTAGPRLLIASNPLRASSSPGAPRTLVVGAGEAGIAVVREIAKRRDYDVVGFVDDDQAKLHMRISGVRVIGTRLCLQDLVRELDIRRVLIAMPSAPQEAISDVVRKCASLGVQCKILPGVYDVIASKGPLAALRGVRLEDLLGRPEVAIDLDRVSGFLRGKRVLVTGAGGSIGSEICRQAARFGAEALMLLGHGENSIYEVSMEMKEDSPVTRLEIAVADIRDQKKMTALFGRFRPDVVFHAAAHKHVPLMELDPREAVEVNVVGTLNVARASVEAGASRFVLISTDKAVNPTSVMGATKRIAEQIVQVMGEGSPIVMSAVRFGNVLGSRGSVVPIFQRQIAKGGPLRLTHPDMTRYFMSIPEATSLVIQAGAMAKNGEVFLLDMGEPVKIIDLARSLITLSGLVPDEDVKIEFIGMRPGEKLCEELVRDGDRIKTSDHPGIFAIDAPDIEREPFFESLEALLAAHEPDEVRERIMSLVPEYRPGEICMNEAAATRNGPEMP